jgi:hypothetical protein
MKNQNLSKLSQDISDITSKQNKLKESFAEIFNGRSYYQLEKFVVDQHVSIERQFDQCVTELQVKYYSIKRMDISRRKVMSELNTVTDEFMKEEKNLDLEEIEFAMIGAIREFNCLYKIYESLPKFTNDQLQNSEAEYWLKRLSIQAQMDIDSTGVISVGNYEALRQINLIDDHLERFKHCIQAHPAISNDVKENNEVKKVERLTNRGFMN